LLKCLDAGANVIKNDHKNIIRKVFFNGEPFITVTNNTNSYVTKDCLNASTHAQRSRYLEKIHGILSLQKKVIKNIIWKVFFICEPFIIATNNTNPQQIPTNVYRKVEVGSRRNFVSSAPSRI